MKTYILCNTYKDIHPSLPCPRPDISLCLCLCPRHQSVVNSSRAHGFFLWQRIRDILFVTSSTSTSTSTSHIRTRTPYVPISLPVPLPIGPSRPVPCVGRRIHLLRVWHWRTGWDRNHTQSSLVHLLTHSPTTHPRTHSPSTASSTIFFIVRLLAYIDPITTCNAARMLQWTRVPCRTCQIASCRTTTNIWCDASSTHMRRSALSIHYRADYTLLPTPSRAEIGSCSPN